MEIIFILVFFARQKARFQETRALVQANLDHGEAEATLKAFESFRKAVFPYERQRALQEHLAQRAVLDKWIGAGPLAMTPQMMVRKHKPQLTRGAQLLTQKEKARESGHLSTM